MLSAPDISGALWQQYESICGHDLFAKLERPKEILKALLTAEIERRPVQAKDIASMVYADPLKDGAVRKHLGTLRRTFALYYATVGQKDRFVFHLEDGPPLKLAITDRDAPTAHGTKGGGALTIFPKWGAKSDHPHELMWRALPGSELRLQTTGFINVGRMTDTIQIALDRGARVRILLTDPECPIFRARFRLRRDRPTIQSFKQDLLESQEMVKTFAEQNPSDLFQYQLCDIMPFGYFLQGDSEGYGPWMLIGLMPAAGSYMKGPMIEVRPAEADLWSVVVSLLAFLYSVLYLTFWIQGKPVYAFG